MSKEDDIYAQMQAWINEQTSEATQFRQKEANSNTYELSLHYYIETALSQIDFAAMKNEKDVQIAFAEQMSKYLSVLREVRTPCLKTLEGLGKEDYWQIDESIKYSDSQLVPIEIKFRKDAEDKRGWGKLVQIDEEKIESLILQYDDVCVGASVFITSNVEDIIGCDNFYGIVSNSVTYPKVTAGYIARVCIIKASAITYQKRDASDKDTTYLLHYKEKEEAEANNQ